MSLYTETAKANRRAEINALRGRCHTMTLTECARETGRSRQWCRDAAKELGERFKPYEARKGNPWMPIEVGEAEYLARHRRILEHWRMVG